MEVCGWAACILGICYGSKEGKKIGRSSTKSVVCSDDEEALK